jgi:plastocyanin
MITPRMAPLVNVHTVNVGSGGNFKYDPDTIFASIGDVVMFKFYPSNHSVVRGEFTRSSACGEAGCNPCVPYELIHPDGQGFHSENVFTQDGNGSVGRCGLCSRI